MWAYESVFYQIYPLGMCGAPFENDGKLEHRILHVLDFIDQIEKLNCNAVYFSPIFESDTHGYNTRDYTKIDVRLGTNDDFKKVVDALHERGIKVIVDGVFNHVGRGFWAFEDVLKKRWDSEYKDWFNINFDGNSNYNDGLWYEGWEGNYDLVKLNLYNENVVNHLLSCVTGWVNEFDIDGIRLDVAYCLTDEFCRRLRAHCDGIKKDFFLVGEVLHGEYGKMLEAKQLHSVTNYQCYKGIHSAFNSYNMFEIIHSLLRLFGPEDWTVARGSHLLSFCDNHDVSRIASIINNDNHVKLVYGMVYGMPGIPIVYYGSEWGIKADKSQGDPALRPYIEKPEWNELSDLIAAMGKAKRESEALNYGGFKSLVLTNKQCVFERESANDRVMVAINCEENPYTAHFDARAGRAHDLITGESIDFGGGLDMPPYSVMFLQPY